MIIQNSIEITAPPERIWQFFVEPEKVLKWSITFRKFDYVGEQREGVGTQLNIEEKAGGPLMKMKFEIADWVENEKLILKMISGAPLKAYEQRWMLEPTENGSIFTFMEEIVMPFGILGKLLEKVGRGSSEKFIKVMLAKLKVLAEA